VIYQGASLGAATWSGTVASFVRASGSWANSGDAAGVLMVYNTHGTIAASTSLSNNTQSVTGFATAGTSGYGSAISSAAGLYVSIGSRGSTPSTQSWQWCDLGWNIQYTAGGPQDFVDLNVALEENLTPQYATTAWKTATSGSSAGWSVIGGTWPAVVATAGDGEMAFWPYFTGTSKPVSGTLTFGGFGFTAADIPPTAAITGMEIQIVSGAVGITGSFTAQAIDQTLRLTNVSGPTPNLASSIPYPTKGIVSGGGSASDYTYATYTFGAPSNVANTPTSLLGYNGITQADIVGANFGMSYSVGLKGAQSNQHVDYSIDQLQIRFSFLPETNQIYFWNGPKTPYTDGAMTSSSTTLTASTSHPFTAQDVGKTITVLGAGVSGAALTTTIATFTDASHVVLSTAAGTTVSGASFNFGTAQRGRVVQHYQQGGDQEADSATGTLYFEFESSSGTIGGLPSRTIGTGEVIRTYPTNAQTPDGGLADGSLYLATSGSAAA